MNAQQLMKLAVDLAPSIMAIVRQLQGRNGSLPSDEEVIAKLQTDSDYVIAVGTKWLAENK